MSLPTILRKYEKKSDWKFYWDLGLSTVKELETDRGILASSRNEIYGAIFGRDSLITSLQLLKVYHQTKLPDLPQIVRKVLISMMELQGTEVNIESGEEPGKIIHEFRPDNHEHLTADPYKPWYLYPDQVMRNYDSLDATPLFLICLYRYLQIPRKIRGDNISFDIKARVCAKNALDWLQQYADTNQDGLVDFILNPKRQYGGLQNQNWMDSVESSFHEDSTPITYPIAPVEAQSYTYLAYRLWANYFDSHDPAQALQLRQRALDLKFTFNQNYLLMDKFGLYLASGIDGQGKPLSSVRSNMGHVLWASCTKKQDGEVDGILLSKYAPKIVKRLMLPDLYVPAAGIRTLSSNSVNYDPNSYHNGSIWPHDTSLVAEGFENYGFLIEAQKLRQAVLEAINHFQTPLELFVFDQTYRDYQSPTGQTSCQKQAWSAGAILSSIAPNYNRDKILLNYLPVRQLTDTVRIPLTATFTLSKIVLGTTIEIKKQVEPFYDSLKKLNPQKVAEQVKNKFK